jgi:predicted ABC-type ATPase
MRVLPLFIVTGASGVGKTAVVEPLRGLLPDWELFETDILWDSGGDWQFVRSNWLRIAHSIAQSGRPTLLCGTLLPEDVDRCDARDFFSKVHYLCLHCSDERRRERLRARPPARGCTEAFIAEQERFARWLLDHGRSLCDPPMTFLDSSDSPVLPLAEQIRNWAVDFWQRERGQAMGEGEEDAEVRARA